MPRGSRGRHTHTAREPSTQDSGSAVSAMVKALRYGLMGPAMKAVGRIIGLMGTVSLLISMVTSTRVTGLMTRPTAKVSTFM